MFSVGDEVVWSRAVSTWGRLTTETVHGVVEQIMPKRIRVRLTSNIKNSLTALVRPDRLRKIQ